MRQISTRCPHRVCARDRRLRRGAAREFAHQHAPLDRHSRAPAPARHAAAPADAGEAWRHARATLARALTARPAAGTTARHGKFARVGLRRRQQHDLRAPPHPRLIALWLVRDHARRLQIVQPALHAAPVRAHEPRTARRIGGDRAPAHHRRHPRDQLRDRRRVPRRALRVTEPKQIALERERARLHAIVPGRPAPARAARSAEQRGHDHTARLVGQWHASWPVPTARSTGSTCGCAIQRHRQRPRAPRQHEMPWTRADARGTAEPNPSRAGDAPRATRIAAR